MPNENLPPMNPDRLADILSEWDSKIDSRIADARGVHGAAQALEQAKQAELTGAEPDQIVTRRERSMIEQAPTNGETASLMVIVPPSDAPMILDVRAHDGTVLDSKTIDPSKRPTKVRIDGLPAEPVGLCLSEIIKTRRLDLRPGRFKIKM